ncbi:MAG: TylF/MycF/NovP-related O-methyltransferase [Candidatus Thorarchaeota archaeon]
MIRKQFGKIINKVLLKILKLLKSYGFIEENFPYDMERDFRVIYNKTKDFTLTSKVRMYSLYKAVKYIVENEIPGDIVECGVWKGGSMMLCAYSLLKLKDLNRKIFLYDTYEGMSKPTSRDVTTDGRKIALNMWSLGKKKSKKIFYAPLTEVKKNLYLTTYPKKNFIFVKGKVEDTIPDQIPDKISILRLDTDLFESTYHELVYLFPRLSTNGVLIIDDYGYWKGAKDATDLFFKENNIKIFLNRIDETGRICIKI